MATEQQIPVLAGKIVEHQGHFSGLPTEDAQWAIQNTVEAIGLFVRAVKDRAKLMGGFFRRLELTAVIPATTGQKTITDAKKLFLSYIDPDFKNWGLDVAGEAKPETPVEALELAKNGTFEQFFNSLGVNLDRLVLTDEQIIWVVKNRPDLLVLNGSANFFLKKKGTEYFVAYVYRDAGGLNVHARRLSFGTVWDAGYRRRVVVPQL